MRSAEQYNASQGLQEMSEVERLVICLAKGLLKYQKEVQIT